MTWDISISINRRRRDGLPLISCRSSGENKTSFSVPTNSFWGTFVSLTHNSFLLVFDKITLICWATPLRTKSRMTLPSPQSH